MEDSPPYLYWFVTMLFGDSFKEEKKYLIDYTNFKTFMMIHHSNRTICVERGPKNGIKHIHFAIAFNEKKRLSIFEYFYRDRVFHCYCTDSETSFYNFIRYSLKTEFLK